MKTKTLFTRLLACLAISATAINADAQPITHVTASTADFTSFPANRNVANLNCDMAEMFVGSTWYTISAFAFDNTVANNVTVMLDLRVLGSPALPVAGQTSFTILNASRPDIAIGHVKSGANWYIAVVYEQSGVAKYDVYHITPSVAPAPLGFPTISTMVAAQVIPSPSAASSWPHVDAISDIASGMSSVNAYPLPEFAISWQEKVGSVDVMKAAYGTFVSPTPLIYTPTARINTNATDVINSDIAAERIYQSGGWNDRMMSIIYTKRNGSTKDLYVETGLMVSGTLTLNTLETAKRLEAPRIESYNWLSGGTSAQWVAACPKTNLSGSREIWEYNNVGSPLNLATVLPAGDYPYTAVSGNLGVPGWSPSPGTYWIQNPGVITNAIGANIVELAPVNVGGGLTNTYLDVNATTLPGGTGVPVAAAGSSTTGNDQLAAWFIPNGASSAIGYKISYGNVGPNPNFRTTGVANMTSAGQISLYPNPTTGNITLSGIEQASYILTDAVGRILNTGMAFQARPIITEWLPAGNYFLQVVEGSKKETLRFVKN